MRRSAPSRRAAALGGTNDRAAAMIRVRDSAILNVIATVAQGDEPE
jgi:hypothetical protein